MMSSNVHFLLLLPLSAAAFTPPTVKPTLPSPTLLPSLHPAAALVGVLAPFGLPSAAQASVTIVGKLPPITSYDPTVVGLVELLLLAGIVLTVAAASEVAKHAIRMGTIEDEAATSFYVSRRNVKTNMAPSTASRRVWLAGRKMPSLEQLTYGCFQIAEAELQNG